MTISFKKCIKAGLKRLYYKNLLIIDIDINQEI